VAWQELTATISKNHGYFETYHCQNFPVYGLILEHFETISGLQFYTAKYIFTRPVLSYLATWQHWEPVAMHHVFTI
jgi:hypothetical protein